MASKPLSMGGLWGVHGELEYGIVFVIVTNPLATIATEDLFEVSGVSFMNCSSLGILVNK